MAENISPVAMKFCPVCGKKFFALYPQLWAYKRGEKKGIKWFCSWHCLRAEENRITIKERGDAEMNRLRLTDAQKLEAVRMAISGDDPRPYLRECGSVNADALWGSIRLWIQGKDPDTAAKLPKVIGHKPRKPVETPEGEVKAPDVPKAVETPEDAVKGPVTPDEAYETFTKYADVKEAKEPEAPKISKPLMHSGKTAIGWRGDFGEYIYDRRHGYIDFESNDGDELSMKVENWKAFIVEFQDIAKLMGVEL